MKRDIDKPAFAFFARIMFIVECARGYSENLGRYDVFDCHDSHWKWFLALGVRYGWAPQGTLFSNRSKREDSGTNAKQDYCPIDWLWAKRFLESDAASLASALEQALPDLRSGKLDLSSSKPSFTLLMEDMSEKSFSEFNSPVCPEKLKDLIDFLRRGEFRFAYDD